MTLDRHSQYPEPSAGGGGVVVSVFTSGLQGRGFESRSRYLKKRSPNSLFKLARLKNQLF